MTTVQLLQSLITSIILPLLISFLVRSTWPTKTKFLVSVLVSAVCSFGLAYFNNQIALNDVPETIFLTVLLTEANYRLWFKQSAIQTWIQIQHESKSSHLNDT